MSNRSFKHYLQENHTSMNISHLQSHQWRCPEFLSNAAATRSHHGYESQQQPDHCLPAETTYCSIKWHETRFQATVIVILQLKLEQTVK